MSFRDTPAMTTVRKLLEHKDYRPYIEQFIPRPEIRYGHIIAQVMEVVDEKPEIAECRRDSIVRAVARAVSWDLQIGKRAYLFPRQLPGWRKPRLMALQSYVGKVEIMIRYRMVRFVRANPIYANEPFEHHEGTRPDIKHLPILREADRGPLVGAYAWTEEPHTRTRQIAVMPIEEIDRIRQEFSTDWADVDLETIPWYCTARAVHRLAKLIPATTLAARVLHDDADDDAWRQPFNLQLAKAS